MALNTDQTIDVIKIFIGLVIAIIGGLWTYTTYTESERNKELDTMIGLGNAIAGMHVTCKSNFDELANLAGADPTSRRGQCYRYFQDAHRMSFAAVITVKKPAGSSTQEWINFWDELQNVIATAGTERYRFDDIENAWVKILVAKQLKEEISGN